MKGGPVISTFILGQNLCVIYISVLKAGLHVRVFLVGSGQKGRYPDPTPCIFKLNEMLTRF